MLLLVALQTVHENVVIILLCKIQGWAKAKFAVVSIQNTVYSYIIPYYCIIYFFIRTPVNLLWPTRVLQLLFCNIGCFILLNLQAQKSVTLYLYIGMPNKIYKRFFKKRVHL